MLGGIDLSAFRTTRQIILVELLSNIFCSRITAVVQTNLYLPRPNTIVSAYTNAANQIPRLKQVIIFVIILWSTKLRGLKKYDFLGAIRDCCGRYSFRLAIVCAILFLLLRNIVKYRFTVNLYVTIQ